MQILNLDADLNISRLDADIRTLRLGEGGTTNYNDLTNKPSINSVTLTGNKTTSDLNIKTSDLINDEGFITNADIPTKTSDLINDSGFQTAAQVSTAVAAAIPTNVSAFTNDAGYITAAQVGNIPTKTSDLTNDSGFITSAEAPVQSVNGYTGAVNLDGSNLDYDAGNSINDKIDAVEAAIPTKTSDLTNDSGFITAAGVPSKTSDLINDSGFITSADIPTDVSAFTNDAGYQTAANVNTLIQAAMPTTETIENESIASFSDGADNVPVSELIVDITATQAGSGTPSPSNPRAISGWSSCDITKTGANLYGGMSFANDILNQVTGATIDTTNKTISYTASNINNKNIFKHFKPNTQYTFFFSMASGRTNLSINYTDGTIESLDNNAQVSDEGKSIKSLSGQWQTGTSILYYEQFGIIEGVKQASDFEPYNGTTYPISLGDTYYGGTLNVTTGELIITHGYVDLGDLTWTKLAGYPEFRASYSANNIPVGKNLPGNVKSHLICSIYPAMSTNETYRGANTGVSLTNLYISVGDDSYSDETAFTNAMSGVQLVYELATPTTVQLTPTEVRTLLNCNIFADTGDINELVYFKTGCEAIARLIEAYT